MKDQLTTCSQTCHTQIARDIACQLCFQSLKPACMHARTCRHKCRQPRDTGTCKPAWNMYGNFPDADI